MEHTINTNIRAKRVLLINDDGTKEELAFREALERADDLGLDLVQVATQSNNDVAICKILNYGSFAYHEKKKREQAAKKQRGGELKVIQLRPATDKNDFNIKIKKATEMILGKNKVKFVIKLKGRESSLKEFNQSIVQKIIEAMSPVAKVEGQVNYSGRDIQITFFGSGNS